MTQTNYSFVANSSNKKIGSMAAISTSSNTCPQSCPLIQECYAKSGHTRIHWNRLDKSGIDFDQLLGFIQSLRRNSALRFNVMGDFAHVNGLIDAPKLNRLTEIFKRRALDVIAYTHHDLNLNLNTLKQAFDAGFKINASCETLTQARHALDNGLNAVITMPINSIKKVLKIGDVTIVRCPAEYNEKIQCANCMLCAKDRTQNRVVVAFTAHGTRKNALSNRLLENGL